VQGLLHFQLLPVNFVYLIFVALAWVGIECYIGGTRLIFSLPAYALLSVCALLTLAGIRGKRIPPNGLSIASTLLLGAWVLGRALYSPIEYLALPDFFMMLGCLMTYLLTAFYLNDILEETVLIVVLWVIAALEIWVGMVQFLKNGDFMLFGLLRPPQVLRASGMYISPNNFAGFLMMVAIVSISFGVWSRWRPWAKILAFYIAFSCMFGIAISGSRGSYFAIIGCMLCFAIASIYAVRVAEPERYVLVVFGTLGALAVVVGAAAFFMTHSELLTHRMQTMVAKDVRLYNWKAAIDHIGVNPWFGTGSGTHLIYGRLFRRMQIQADPVHAHCDYLELLAEYGIAGAICMALFIFAHVRNGLRSYSEILRQRLIPSGLHRSNAFAIQVGALCAVAGLAIHSVVDFDMHIPGSAMIFAFLFGVLANPGLERNLSFADRRIVPIGKLILPALGVLMLWRGLPLIPSEYCAETARVALRDHRLLDSIVYARKGVQPLPPPREPEPGEEVEKPELIDTLLRKFGPNPKNPNLFFYIGEANRAMGARWPNRFLARANYENAVTAFQSGLKLFPQDETMLVRCGMALDGLGRFDEAEALYQKALSWDPNSFTIQEYYERHLIAEGKRAEAEALAKVREAAEASEVDTGHPKGDFRLQ
jgi:O-antigen ligase